jgi:hypothetical protein
MPDIDPDDAPAIKEHDGPWDNLINRIILIAPWIAILGVGGWILYTDSVSTDIVIGGDVSAAPLIYAGAAIVVATYILAVMKFYGSSPVAWIASIADSYERGDTNE